LFARARVVNLEARSEFTSRKAARDPAPAATARGALVVSEMALACVDMRCTDDPCFVTLRGVNPGFDPHNVLTLQVSLNGPAIQRLRALSCSAQLAERIERLPASKQLLPPLSPTRRRRRFTVVIDATAHRGR
jgi:hypothetical protein